MKSNLIKIKGVVVPVIQRCRNIYENSEYLANDGNMYSIKMDKERKNLIGTHKDGSQIIRPIQDYFGPIPFTYENEYNDCKTLYSRGINIEEIDDKFSNDNFKLIEIFKVGNDENTGLEVFNIVWQKQNLVTVGIYTNGHIGFDVRSETFSIEELQKYIEIAQYLKKNYKE